MKKSHTLRLSQPSPDSLPRGLAIETRYAGLTDTRGSRIIATCRRDSETVFRTVVPYDHGCDCLGAHYQGALACLRKIEAQNKFYSFTIQAVGSTADGYVFITLASDRGADATP